MDRSRRRSRHCIPINIIEGSTLPSNISLLNYRDFVCLGINRSPFRESLTNEITMMTIVMMMTVMMVVMMKSVNSFYEDVTRRTSILR